MVVKVNGETRTLAPGATVAMLLEGLGLDASVTVVERNADILERSSYPDTILADGDVLELIRFVGGG
ncbi:MAG: sulfur carrier protein ThiS [Candidatus Hydrogenedentes bacterium]|nr:sulfur carrier protein ThiS [Candidatus Hydrogenedentota bacterium]